jgi:hypothetical protein
MVATVDGEDEVAPAGSQRAALRATCDDIVTFWRSGVLFAAMEVVFGGLFDALFRRRVERSAPRPRTPRRDSAE